MTDQVQQTDTVYEEAPVFGAHPEIRIVYFTTNTRYTERFTKKLGYPAERIPQTQGRKGREADDLVVDYQYVLILPTYGSGAPHTAVMRQVKKFLAIKQNRDHCIGVIAGGNTNFGRGYGIAGDVISKKLKIPMLYRYEIMGTQRDVQNVRQGLEEEWDHLCTLREKSLAQIAAEEAAKAATEAHNIP